MWIVISGKSRAGYSMILQQWFEEVWDKGDVAAIDRWMSPDVVVHNLLAGGGERVYDRAAFRALFEPVLALLRDVHVAVEHEFSEGDLVVARCVITAVYDGKDQGAMARSRPIHFTGMAMVRVGDGRIDESWNYFDFETMYQQME
jgi:steroid delta-isomerase-like uncharacterized protein